MIRNGVVLLPSARNWLDLWPRPCKSGSLHVGMLARQGEASVLQSSSSKASISLTQPHRNFFDRIARARPD
jgi:hypothetical protein